MRSTLLFTKVPIIKTPSRNLTSCVTSLQKCAQNKRLGQGQQLHAFLLTSGLHFSSPSSTTSLIHMYAKNSRMDQALLVFNTTKDEFRNVFVFNSVISGFISNGSAKEAVDFYWGMRESGVLPDKYTFPCLIKGFCEVLEVLEVKKVHALVFKLGLDLDVFVGSALVNSYLKFELMEEAGELFDEIPERDVVLWNSMVNGYAQAGRFNEALGIFRRMSEEGVPTSSFTVTGVLSVFAVLGDLDNGRAAHALAIRLGFDRVVEVCNALIDMYGKCKCVGDALKIFENMEGKDIFSWNSIIFAHQQCGDHEGTLRFFDRMLGDHVRPDLVTVAAVLPACSHLAALMHGREIHGYTIVNGLMTGENVDNTIMSNAVMDMYAKCGSMRDANLVFDRLSSKDAASWNVMIMGYGMHGYGSEALDTFSHMCKAGFKPDEITFVGVLSACSHAGFVSQGQEFLGQMELKYGVVPTIEHYVCVIDMLGRAGQLEEAYKLALKLPIEANPVVWRALLAACSLHRDTELAEVAAQRVLELEQGHCGNYVLMSNIYVATGRYKEVLDVRHSMRQQNVKKRPGCSWIEVQNIVHTFMNSDQSHLDTEVIYSELNLLTASLREHGYVPHI